MNFYTVSANDFYLAVIKPAFQDIIPEGFPYNGTLNEFTIMDNVGSKKNIINIRRVQNILQRRDASCDYIYKKVFGADTRKITTDELYGATKFCRNEFYQGDLKDWRSSDPLFGDRILPFFQGAVNIDVASNSYFGDIERVASPTAQWSTNVFDGVFKHIEKYITAGIIPAGQTFAIADGTDYSATPTAAYTLLNNMYNAQPVLMGSFVASQLAFYVSKEIYDGYADYLSSIQQTAGNTTILENGKSALTFKGIALLVEPIWTPVITELKGSKGYAAVLTVRGNFVFATDKDYGEGEDGKTALEVWYERKESQWYYRMFLKAGTEIALPEYVIVALSDWN
ncbi:hypothetical protein ACLOAU_14665 [Niabella sp. CJ426]|uniref:hypothetical protein n=1 Tax=Niabella sp. CJ426 TaxID=3393740 RepID=UPI003D06D2BB